MTCSVVTAMGGGAPRLLGDCASRRIVRFERAGADAENYHYGDR